MQRGGLLVVPAAPALIGLQTDTAYRDALTHADLVLPDSAFMVLVWNRLQGDRLLRLSGLKYLRALLLSPDAQAIEVPRECVYVAPMYGADPSDASLVALLERLRPQHVLLTVGGGVQEKLGWNLKQQLSYTPSIHCVGAAIAFLSGVQTRIPVWADRLYLGWLFRSVSDPGRFVPRYWAARKLLGMLVRFRDRAPLPEILS
jgi:UDP-N-acetyl-D-mannosaminuronic acid transferase (WecB/TagA/CpsF family)